MRIWRIGAAAAAVSLAVFATPAHAAPSLDLQGLSVVASADGPSQQTSLTVTSTLEQLQYANIEYQVIMQGFKVTKPFGESTPCPASAVSVTVPTGGSVFQCSLSQQGTNALLAFAIEGTFNQGPIAVAITPGNVMTPRPPGQYTVSVSSWAFPTQTATLTFSAQSYRSCSALRADYPTGIARNVAGMRRATASGFQAPLVNPSVFAANRSLPGAPKGTVCPTR